MLKELFLSVRFSKKNMKVAKFLKEFYLLLVITIYKLVMFKE